MPLAFAFPEDDFARRVEDEVMIGESLLIAPVYEQNARGRYVYLPEEMLQVLSLIHILQMKSTLPIR